MTARKTRKVHGKFHNPFYTTNGFSPDTLRDHEEDSHAKGLSGLIFAFEGVQAAVPAELAECALGLAEQKKFVLCTVCVSEQDTVVREIHIG